MIDASGLVVAPGFIDPHTHARGDLASDDPGRRANLPFVFQGVTTVVVGNDGGGPPDIAVQAEAASANGIGTNVAFLVGFGPVRESVLGKRDRTPTPTELAQMERSVRAAMCEGAWGFSTGLYYVPQSYAQTEEVIALARVAAGLGGYYDTHMRDESTYNITVTGALAETLRIGREAGMPVHIAHIKALGPAVWGHSARMIALVEEARKSGQQVTADQYPWSASGTRVSSALVPRWALEGGLERLRERLSDEANRSRIRDEIVETIARRGGADRLLVTGRLSGSTVPLGQTLLQIAQDQSIEPADAAIAILLEGDARLASFNMSEADIAAFARQDWVVTGSDGSTGHPRKYGSFPKAYRDFVEGNASMSLARFIRRSSGQTADIIGLDRRGYLKPGYFADIVVFDPDRFAPRADYRNPRELSEGVEHLLINGVPTIAGGEYTGALPGRPLLNPTECGPGTGAPPK
ncbi:MAG: amidohydrolase family protein [Erythrobacter sp.]|nr:amidohydrolase family protein [Erythrobacter sp.]